MTPVWQCIGIVVWPWVLAGGKGHLHHRVTFFFFNRKISSNWVGCFLIPLKISLNFLYSLCVCIHMYMLCAHQVFMLTGPRPAWLYTLFFVMKSITDLGYHPGTLLSPPSTGVTGAFYNSRLSRVLAIQIWVLMFAQWAQYPLSHLTKPKDQFLWVKYQKSSCLLISQVGSCFVDNFYTSLK